jgi:hypothetical protein
MTQANRALETLTPYLDRMGTEALRANRTQVWLEVISSAEGYDREATAEADPSDTNEVAVFADGSRLWWNHELKCWEAGPE